MVVSFWRLMDTLWSVILPPAVQVWYVIMMRTYIQNSIPQSLGEAATLDGCSDIGYLTRVVLPLSKPILAVITLYVAVALWNAYFNAMLYLGDSDLQPLQIFLRRVLLQASNEVLQSAGGQAAAAAAENTLKIRYVCIVLAAVPIFLITPFVQKYLVSGTMLGAVKG